MRSGGPRALPGKLGRLWEAMGGVGALDADKGGKGRGTGICGSTWRCHQEAICDLSRSHRAACFVTMGSSLSLLQAISPACALFLISESYLVT